mmetsp:Transcript_612/g.1109  ORF Transcript_612/g.1109 Transcript_612/m.1109 type:complete len:998 (-) Transcript_612:47-3040(-)|eukprot:CAMPEP_0176482264 /NCGR_PEP_ID=MMETSP0200_2-20121128/3281_1 /TAXON_ID=947934 /ORGANISM="Chaetoceros sp., Strain GSL56" /LENGTH=997 /DNA_ID=CAMNT_0017878565 /DNA_START=109 /DNA_END=3102 /DNA_ORIENTATION=+
MRVQNKLAFRRKRKGDQSLLSDAEVSKLSDFHEIDERHEESRNDQCESSAHDYGWSVMPYQIASIQEQSTNTASNREQVDTFHAPEILKETKSFEKKSASYRRMPGSTQQDCKGTSSTSNHALEKLKNSHSDDIFDDLHSIRDRIIYQVDSLEDIMNEKSLHNSTSNIKSIKSFKIDMDSSETDDFPTGPLDNFPVDPKILKKKGILIVDPKKNGEIYHMDDMNKNLTDKELIIIGQRKRSSRNAADHDFDDDMSLMSNLTDVTYQKSKEERIKYIMSHLTDAAAQIPESRMWCSMFECNPFSNHHSNGKVSDVVADLENDERKPICANSGEPSIAQNARMFFNSLYAVSSKKAGRSRVDVGSFAETVTVCITRIYLSLHEGENDNGLRCTYNEPKLCHDLGVYLKEGKDGQGVVVDVLPDSTAQKSGVEIGDILSFAVPLNNTFQGYEKACDFISRLELIGMRTSYREVFDMFLSKTSSGWPVATVFRRGSVGTKTFENMPLGLLSVDMSIDLSRASSFFHEIVTLAREYDYHRESSGVQEIIRGNIETFMPKPHSRTAHQRNIKARRIDFVGEKAQSFGLDTTKEARWALLPDISDDNYFQPIFLPELRRSNLLTWYTENSDAILYLKFTGTFGGSGVAVTRIKEGAWSAPCVIGANVLGCGLRIHADPIECIIFLRDVNDIEGLKRGERITLGGEEQKERVAVVTKIAGRFCKETFMRCTCYPRNDLNALAYTGNEDINLAGQILSGYAKYPVDAIVFSGALRRLELPSTMYPHPTPPNNLVKFSNSDWTVEKSCMAYESLEPPFDEKSITTLRDLLKTFQKGEKFLVDECKEFEIFTQKFRQMLYDGVTIDRAWPVDDCEHTKDNSFITKVTMRLESMMTDAGREDVLLFLAKKSKTSTQKVDCDFCSPGSFPKKKCLSQSLELRNIVHITQTLPKNFLQKNTSLQEGRKQRKRFVMLQSEDGKGVPILARTAKDASLLACGLKLLAEKIIRS